MKNLKKYILIALAVLFTNLSFAQKNLNPIQEIPCSTYTPDTEMDTFVGNWKWTSGNDSFEILLKKEKVFHSISNDHSCVDRIIGFHQYVKNGTIIESSLQHQNTNFAENLMSIYGYIVAPNQILWAGVDILSNGNHVKMELEYIDANHVKIKSLNTYPGTKLYLPGQTIPSSEITLPQDIILTKQ
ncbi:DUF6705 family protein [Chryseobacterium indoltheticum]|uniref:DUF6705 domain-containing protein n=1 Tax=Chryseobacterium indoltheticum TaxID=254 RepID=A0A381FHY9_9FLAO|nr:DUF6705 family protein [Chryseobacterium indoltheticum]SUX46134.1 Uncharacterised protein [Chryseobacterium indoltheticum]